MENRGIVVIGAGPAGLAAAVKLRRLGAEDVLVIERENETGGILRQCIHDGFGLERFGKSISGPEYAALLKSEAEELGIECLTGTSVLEISKDRTITAASPSGPGTADRPAPGSRRRIAPAGRCPPARRS